MITARISLMLGVFLLLSSALGAASPLLECERERYYEGETVQCMATVPDTGSYANTNEIFVLWSILGKELQKQTRWLGGVNSHEKFEKHAPTGLRAVTPLKLSLWFFSSSSAGSKMSSSFSSPNYYRKPELEARVNLFPRDPKYWVGPEEFKTKKILVEKDVEWVGAELDALGIPYERATGRDLQAQKRFDLTLTETLLKPLDRKDPWSRWELLQLLRRELSTKQDAKDLAPGTSN